MNKNIIILFLSVAIGADARQLRLEEVLQSVEMNNRELRVLRQQNAVQNQANRTENNLENPNVEYVHQWGTPGQAGNSSELNVTQSFDFPTLYAQRSKLSRERATLYEYQYQELRRDILLRAEQLSYDLVLINKRLELLWHEKEQIGMQHQDFEQSVEEGELTGLQGKKLKTELLNLHVGEVNLRTDREKILRELIVLNGGMEIDVTATSYAPVRELMPFEQFLAEVTDHDPRLRSQRQEQRIADREVRVSQHQNMPSVELGYRRTTGFEEEFNGVIMGLSVPLFQNRGKVKQARLQRQLAEMQYESQRSSVTNGLRASYDEVVALKKLLDKYGEVSLDEDWCGELKKAFDAHDITIIEYFSELSLVHGTYINRLELENRYYKALAELYKNVP